MAAMESNAEIGTALTSHEVSSITAASVPRQDVQPVASSLGWSLLNNVLARAGSIASGIVLARLLAPTDYGLFAVALVVLSAVLSVNELGVSVAVVRWEHGVDRIAPTVVTISMVSSGVFYLGCFLLAPAVATALNGPEAVPLIRVLSLCVLVDGVAAVPAALMTRAFAQRRRLVIDLMSFVAGTLISVGLAFAGYGSWAIVLGFLATNVINGVSTVVAAPSRPRPGFSTDAARSLLEFGLPLAGASLLLFAMLNLDYIIVGHVLGAAALGFYLLAFNLSAMPVNLVSSAVRRVSLAAFALMASQPQRAGDAFARSLGLVLLVTLPFCVLLALYADDAISVVYGSKWLTSASVVTWLCVLAAARLVLEISYDYLVAVGRSRSNFWLQFLWVACLVPALYVGARAGGVVGVARGHAVVVSLVVLPVLLLILRRSHVPLLLLARQCWPALIGSVVIWTSSLVVRHLELASLKEAAVGGVAGAALYVIVVARHVRAVRRRGWAQPEEQGG